MPQRVLAAGMALLRRDDTVNWALIDQALISGVNFLTTILVARFLGVEEFGRFALAWFIVLFAASIHASLIVWPMMSLGPKHGDDETPGYFGAVAVQHLLYSAVTLPVLLLAVWAMAHLVPAWRLDGLALPIACAALLVQTQDTLRRYFFTRERGLAAFVNDAVRYLGQLAVLTWLLITVPMDAAGALWVIAATAAAAVLAGLLRRADLRLDRAAVTAALARHWRFGKWLTASAVVAGLAGNTVSFATGAMLGAAAIGAVHSAYAILGVTHIVHFGLTNVALVRAAALYHDGGGAAMTPFLWRIAWWMLGGTAAIALVAVAAPEFWLGLLLGAAYAPYGYLLVWWAAIVLIEAVVLPLESGLRAMEATRPAFLAELWRLLAAAILLYPLIRWFGMTGVMLCFLALAVVRTGVLAAALRRRLRE